MQFFLIYVGTSWLFSGPSVFDGYECLYSHSKRTDDQSAAKEIGIISQLSYGHPKRTGGQSSAKEKGVVIVVLWSSKQDRLPVGCQGKGGYHSSLSN